MRQQHLGLVDEHLGRDRRAGRLVGLVLHARDARPGTHRDDVLLGCLGAGDLGGDDRAVGAALEVRRDHRAQVEGPDLVGAGHDDRVGPEAAHRVGEAREVVGVAGGEPVLGRRPAALLRHQPAQATAGAVEVPGPARREVPVQGAGLVLNREPDVGDAAVHQVRQGNVDQLVGATEGERGLGALTGEHVEARTLPARLDDGQDGGVRTHQATVPDARGPEAS